MKSQLSLPILLLASSSLALSADRSSIRAAYEAGHHTAYPQKDGTLNARNPGQQRRTEFDGMGFTVTPDHGQWFLVLKLTAYGERTPPRFTGSNWSKIIAPSCS